MTDIAASLGKIQLKKLDSLNEKRRSVVEQLNKIMFKNEWLSTLEVAEGDKSAHYGLPILIEDTAPFTRKDICHFLESKGIETRALMMGCLPDQPAFRNLEHRIVGDLKFSRVLRDKAFFIGCHPAIGKEKVKYLENVVNQFFNNL